MDRGVSVSQSTVATTYEDVTYRIIGAAMTVHNKLGPGLKEVIYQRALSQAMTEAGLSFEEERPFQVTLDEAQVGLLYLDHLVEGSIVVEEKALSHLITNEEVAQLITYLAVAEAPLGLLLNFGRRKLEYKRILPPKKFADWKARAARYAWNPAVVAHPNKAPYAADAHPLIRSSSADQSPIDQVLARTTNAHPLIRSTSADGLEP